MENRYEELKALHRKLRNELPSEINLRVHRALSWLQAAEQSTDEDSRFLHLWISFNAAYAREFDAEDSAPEKSEFHRFLSRVSELDTENRIHDLAWDQYAAKIRVFIDNKYVFASFWAYQQGKISEEEWQTRFSNSKRAAQQALATRKTPIFLSVLFDRLYTLRNQLVHGGATWNSKTNRSQVGDGNRILHSLIPILIHILLENPNEEWGSPSYPPVD